MLCVLQEQTGDQYYLFYSVLSSEPGFTFSLIEIQNILYLPEEDVAVCAEVQGVTVLLSVRIAAAQLKVHLLPL